MHRRYCMPKPEIPTVDPSWDENRRKAFLLRHENAYIKKMKEEGLFLKAIADEIAADEDQTTHALRCFHKCYLEQKEGVMGDVGDE